jgi:hypothetical protein
MSRFREKPPKTRPCGESIPALGSLADFAIRRRPLDRLLTDQTSAPVEAGMAAASAESFPRIGDRHRQFRATAQVAASLPNLFGKFGHSCPYGGRRLQRRRVGAYDQRLLLRALSWCRTTKGHFTVPFLSHHMHRPHLVAHWR